jgi:PPOX class probable F420-dependent enzyme
MRDSIAVKSHARPYDVFTEAERRYLDGASLGRLATADADGRPHVIPVCFALQEGTVVTPIDEKPKRGDPDELRRSRDIRENPRVSLVVDHYASDWSNLGWVQVRGTAGHVTPGEPSHAGAVSALRATYDQYASHALSERPIIRIDPGRVLSWGTLDRPVND